MVARACFDLYTQGARAATGKGGLLEQLPALAKKGITEENLAKARKESFFDPNTGKYDTSLGSIKKMGEDQVPPHGGAIDATDTVARVGGGPRRSEGPGQVRLDAGVGEP